MYYKQRKVCIYCCVNIPYLSLSKFEGNVYYVSANVLKLFRGRHFKWHFVVKPDRASTKHRELAQQGSNSGTPGSSEVATSGRM
jgi:hypothetical protein